jgi:hypothetical protein
VLALANAAETTNALRAETELAKQLGIFGSPTFVVGRELFWGDDRLADAVNWYRRGQLGPAAEMSRPATTRRNTQTTTSLDIPEPDSLGG